MLLEIPWLIHTLVNLDCVCHTQIMPNSLVPHGNIWLLEVFFVLGLEWQICTNSSLFSEQWCDAFVCRERVWTRNTHELECYIRVFGSCRETGIHGLKGFMLLSPALGTNHTFISYQEVNSCHCWSEWLQGLESCSRDLHFGAWDQLLRHGGVPAA